MPSAIPLWSSALLTIASNAALIASWRMGAWRPHLNESSIAAKGEPNDLVTAADSQIEALIRGYILRLRPDDEVVGEEGADAQDLEMIDGGAQFAAGLLPVTSRAARDCEPARLQWHIDPIDGTVNYVRGIEAHCVSVGACLAPDDSPAPDAVDAPSRTSHPARAQWVVGLVLAPMLRTLWVAGTGAGAWKLGGEPHSLPFDATTVAKAVQLQAAATAGLRTEPVRRARQTAAPLDDSAAPVSEGFTALHGTPPGRRGAVVATGFSYSGDRRAVQLREFAAVMERFDDARRIGSAAIDLCLAAEGRVNAYYERGLGVYDWAAGALIAQEAGLHVVRPLERAGVFVAADTAATCAFIQECTSG